LQSSEGLCKQLRQHSQYDTQLFSRLHSASDKICWAMPWGKFSAPANSHVVNFEQKAICATSCRTFISRNTVLECNAKAELIGWLISGYHDSFRRVIIWGVPVLDHSSISMVLYSTSAVLRTVGRVLFPRLMKERSYLRALLLLQMYWVSCCARAKLADSPHPSSTKEGGTREKSFFLLSLVNSPPVEALSPPYRRITRLQSVFLPHLSHTEHKLSR